MQNGTSRSDVGTDFRAAEALNSMDAEVSNSGESISIDSSRTTSRTRASQEEVDLEAQDLPRYLLGKSFFDCKEYERAAFVLKDCRSYKSKFLRMYSKFQVPESFSTLTLGWRETKGG